MNIQEQEEIDFNWGRANEFQNSYDFSHMQYRRQDDTAKIRKASENGMWVAVMRVEVCCPVTDALMGVDTILHTASASLAEIEEIVGEESSDFYIVPPELGIGVA